eukprot:jgi/Mesen1/5580/ME000281S04645
MVQSDDFKFWWDRSPQSMKNGYSHEESRMTDARMAAGEGEDAGCSYTTVEQVRCRNVKSEEGFPVSVCEKKREIFRQCAGRPRELVESTTEQTGGRAPAAGRGLADMPTDSTEDWFSSSHQGAAGSWGGRSSVSSSSRENQWPTQDPLREFLEGEGSLFRRFFASDAADPSSSSPSFPPSSSPYPFPPSSSHPSAARAPGGGIEEALIGGLTDFFRAAEEIVDDLIGGALGLDSDSDHARGREEFDDNSRGHGRGGGDDDDGLRFFSRRGGGGAASGRGGGHGYSGDGRGSKATAKAGVKKYDDFEKMFQEV